MRIFFLHSSKIIGLYVLSTWMSSINVGFASAPSASDTTSTSIQNTHVPPQNGMVDPTPQNNPNTPVDTSLNTPQKPLSPNDVAPLLPTQQVDNTEHPDTAFETIPLQGSSPTSINQTSHNTGDSSVHNNTPSVVAEAKPLPPCCAHTKEMEKTSQTLPADAGGIVLPPAPVTDLEKIAPTNVATTQIQKPEQKDTAESEPLQDTQRAHIYFTDELNFTTNPHGLKNAVETHDARILIVDVRDEDAFKEGHVPGAINMPWKKYNGFDGDETEFTELSKQKIAYVYCYEALCNLGAKAARKFASLGYPVKEVRGGYKAWADMGGQSVR